MFNPAILFSHLFYVILWVFLSFGSSQTFYVLKKSLDNKVYNFLRMTLIIRLNYFPSILLIKNIIIIIIIIIN